MIAIVIESFFKHSSDRKEFGRKYNNIIANYPIISVNQRTAKINIQDIDYVYNKYENEYVPIFEANCVSGKLLLSLSSISFVKSIPVTSKSGIFLNIS